MLGEKIGEEQGKVTSRRILPGDDYRYVKMEMTFETQGTVLGISGMNIGTYVVFERIPGQMYGEGRGIFMAMDGQSGIWNGMGVGHFNEDGTISFASSVTFQTDSPGLKRLNDILILVEHVTDMENNARSTLYEWKV